MGPRIANALVGIWLMAAPAVLGYGNPAQANDRITGPLAAALAVIALWETTRELRWCNFGLGLWLLAAPWLLGYGEVAATVNDTLAGILLAVLSLRRGRIEKRYGGGWRAIWRGEGL